MRTVKKPEDRRNEIMNLAENLFIEKGVDRTSVNDIIRAVGVAKGTFYWYFKSKEELLDALVERDINRYLEEINPVVSDENLSAVEKLKRIIEVHNRAYGEHQHLQDFFHRPESALTHQKHLIQEMKTTAPLLTAVVEQGVREGLFDTTHPREVIEFMLLSLTFLLGPMAFEWNQEDPAAKFKALRDILERALGAAPGTLDFLDSLLEIGGKGSSDSENW